MTVIRIQMTVQDCALTSYAHYITTRPSTDHNLTPVDHPMTTRDLYMTVTRLILIIRTSLDLIPSNTNIG